MCEICWKNPCVSGCPNYKPKESPYICYFCGENICVGEEYIENIDGEYAHLDCVPGIHSLIEWFGYDVKEMGD